MEVASSSTRGGGWAPSEKVSPLGPARAARRALSRHRSRAGALPSGHFDHAVPQLLEGEQRGGRQGRSDAAALVRGRVGVRV